MSWPEHTAPRARWRPLVADGFELFSTPDGGTAQRSDKVQTHLEQHQGRRGSGLCQHALRIADQLVAAIITSSRLSSAYDARLFNLLDPPMTLDDNALAQLFFAARTHNAWADRPVADELLQQLYDTLKWAPTSPNCSPGRFVFVKSTAAKERLRPAMDAGNLDKTMAAPVTVIVATDFAFYEHLGKLFPHAPDARSWFAGKPEAIQTGGFRNGTLQGAYLRLAPRAGPRLRSDVRLQQRQGRRGVLCRHRDSIQFPGQPRLR